MLQALTTKEAPPQLTLISEITSVTLDPQPSRGVNVTCTEFGLPPNYSPPFEKTPGVDHSTQQVMPMPLVPEIQPIVHIVAQAQFNDPRLVYHVVESLDDNLEEKCEIKGVKEHYQTLEKRLRATEGDNDFSDAARDMCLASDMEIPSKFNTPDFKK